MTDNSKAKKVDDDVTRELFSKKPANLDPLSFAEIVWTEIAKQFEDRLTKLAPVTDIAKQPTAVFKLTPCAQFPGTPESEVIKPSTVNSNQSREGLYAIMRERGKKALWAKLKT